MKNHFWRWIAVMLLAAQTGGAQNGLPPGTELPADTGGASAQPASGASVLAEAENKIAQRDLDGAKRLLEQYLGSHPGDARGLFDLGYVDDAANREDAAAADYRQAIAADPKQFESRLALGLLLAHRGDTVQAREQLLEATRLTPAAPNPAAQAQAFRALAELDRVNDPEEAREALLSALRLSPEMPEDLLLTGEIAEAGNDPETAETAYNRLLAAKGASPATVSAALSGLGQLLLRQQKYSDAEPLLKDGLKREPDDPALNAQLATALIAQGKNSEALPILEKLRQLEPGNASVDQMLADAYSQAGHPEKADPIYAEMAQAHPQDPAVLAAQGRNLILEGQYPAAQEVLERAVKLKPDDGDAWSGLAFSASQNKQYSMALQALSMRAKYLPETPATYFLWATSYDNLHQTKAAEDFYRKFLSVAAGKFPDQEWQAKHRLIALGRSHSSGSP